MNAAQKRWAERKKKGKVYSLPRDARLPRRFGRVQVYVDDGERTYAYVGWHPTFGEHAMLRQGKIKLAGRLKKGECRMKPCSALHMNGQYQRKPWGYLGMTVHIYRPIVKGPARIKRLYAMRSLKGVIATARTMDALADMARREQWVARYRHVDADGREIWVTVPE
jgi:hypothetical protein